MNLIRGFLEAATRFPKNTALEVADACLSYEELAKTIGFYQSLILSQRREPSPFIGLVANRSKVAYAGLLAILASGKAYFPIPYEQPTERLLKMISDSGTKTFIVGEEASEAVQKLRPHLPAESVFIFPERETVLTQLECPQVLSSRNDDLAYLLFTSGSTGNPKGILISHENALAYIKNALRELDYYSAERVSLTFDLNFDPSVHDMFTTWYRGATLVVLPKIDLLFNHGFINEKRLTSWHSVPFQIYILMKAKILKPGSFPHVRRSLFCGEALPVEWAKAWAEAAPNSTITNVYGPSEITVYLTKHLWSKTESQDSYVPIGKVFSDHQYNIVENELWLAGPQVGQGYLANPELTAKKFPTQDGTRWYKTGDLVEEDENQILHFKGRVDQQIKIRGFRVEVEEIHKVLNLATDAKQVVALPWPKIESSNSAIYAFVVEPKTGFSEETARRYCREHLPDYMVPKKILEIDSLPRSPNGKLDRAGLYSILESRSDVGISRNHVDQ